MGCDIHLYVEKIVNGVWTSIEDWKQDKYNTELLDTDRSFYDGRNYVLFSILANVRNSGNIKPIAYPKGLPVTCDPMIKLSRAWWQNDAHSESYLTLHELQKYKWDKTIKEYIILTEQEYKDWKASGKQIPESWFKEITIFDDNYIKLNETEYCAGEEINELDPTKKYFIEASFRVQLSEYCSDFYCNTMSKLRELDEDPKKVRIVFWFDN